MIIIKSYPALATFNLKLGIIKIVPAFVGWIVALVKINNMRNENNNVYFGKAVKYSFI